jgi:type III pantothenate kinase
MLLAVDVGNTQTHLGVFDRGKLEHQWRASTDPARTADELALLFGEFLSLADLSFSRQITGVAISSVVPPITQELREMTLSYFGFPPIVVEPGIRTGISVATDNPREVGADRIANAVAAHAMFPDDAVVVVDFGTAITVDAVSSNGQYMGGAIAPGVETSASALFQSTAQISRVALVRPECAIGRNTVTAVQSGIMYGTAAMVDGLVDRVTEELEGAARVVATGGTATVLVQICRRIEHYDPILTLTGLRLIYDRNAEGAQ